MFVVSYSILELNRTFLLDWKVMHFELINFCNWTLVPYWDGDDDERVI